MKMTGIKVCPGIKNPNHGFSIKIINGDDKNFKITKKIDWELAKIIASENKL